MVSMLNAVRAVSFVYWTLVMFSDLVLRLYATIKIDSRHSGGFRGGAQRARAPPFGGIFANDL